MPASQTVPVPSMPTPSRGGAPPPAPAAEPDTLTVPEVAGWLRVPVATIYQLARTGRLPAVKIGKHWRFSRRELEAWRRQPRDVKAEG
jgi:excisionase family DNA binding protein